MNSAPEGDLALKGLAGLFEQACRRVSHLSTDEELSSQQWSALRFFARAGSQARTVGGAGFYLGSSQSTASRTVASLVDKGLLSNVAGDGHPRAKFFTLTEAGTAKLKEDPLLELESIVQALSPVERVALTALLEKLLEALPDRTMGQ